MALGIFEQLAWLTKKVKQLCCIVENGGGGGSALTIKDDGTTLTTAATSIDFTGDGVTATNTGSAVTVNIPGPSYTVYTALLTQEPGDILSVVVLENTIGDIVWTHPSAGTYTATLAGAFPLNKTAMFITPTIWNSTNNTYITSSGNGDNIVIETYNAANIALSDDILGYTTVEIRVYP